MYQRCRSYEALSFIGEAFHKDTTPTGFGYRGSTGSVKMHPLTT